MKERREKEKERKMDGNSTTGGGAEGQKRFYKGGSLLNRGEISWDRMRAVGTIRGEHNSWSMGQNRARPLQLVCAPA